MPLYKADPGSFGPIALTQVPDQFIIFYSSPVNGQLWCPDCRDVEDLVKDTFDKPDAPNALIVYVGDKPQWKTPSNPFRKEPWALENIPTIVKMDNGKEVSRLVGEEVLTGLKAFVEA